MSASLDNEAYWNYRKNEQRLIIFKTKNDSVRKAAAVDVLTNLPIAINIPERVSLEELELGKEYLARLKVYTSKELEGVDMEFFNFFNVVDVDQAFEDFIKAYWVYPSKIRFDLTDVEEP